MAAPRSPLLGALLAALMAALGLPGCEAHDDAVTAEGLVARLAAEAPALPASRPAAVIGTATSTWATLAEQERDLLARFDGIPSPEVLLGLARTYTLAEEYAAALPYLVALLERGEPATVPQAWAWLGARQYGVGDAPGARAACERALELAGEVGAAHFTLARLALDVGDSQAAAPHLREVHRLEPANTTAALELARVLEDRGEGTAAEKVLTRTLQTDRTHPALLWRLARLARDRGAELEAQAFEERHARAIRLEDLGLRTSGLPEAEQSLLLGLDLVRAGLHEQALPELERAIAQTRDAGSLVDATAATVLALCALGRGEDAARALAELERLAPDDPRRAELAEAVEAAR